MERERFNVEKWRAASKLRENRLLELENEKEGIGIELEKAQERAGNSLEEGYRLYGIEPLLQV